MEKLKVIFKKEYNPYTEKWEVFAVFPTLPATYGNFQCYTSEGWTECSYEYYATARRAFSHEYAEMLTYLEKQFDGSDGDEPCELVVGRRISYDMCITAWRR